MTASQTSNGRGASTEFVRGLIDYAGLFPPAALSPEAAVRTYVRHRSSVHSWMLNRLIWPAQRLNELLARSNRLDPLAGTKISVLGSPAADGDVGRQLSSDIEAIVSFEKNSPPSLRCDALELAPNEDTGLDLLDHVLSLAKRAGLTLAELYVEERARDDWRGSLYATLSTLRLFNSREGDKPLAGYKLRCGGPRPESVPSAERVAFTIHSCILQGVRFKATAGLHQPFVHASGPDTIEAHGFVNVFGAAVLGKLYGFSEAEIRDVVADTNVGNFNLDLSALSWRQYSADADAIRHARAALATSFGSCSFDEPRDDLIAAGLLRSPT